MGDDWLDNIRMCGGFVREFMMDPRAFRDSCRIEHLPQSDVNVESSHKVNEVSDGHAGHDAQTGVVDHVEQSIMANDVLQLNVNTVDGPSADCFQPETDMVNVDHAGHDTPIVVVDHVEQSIMANDVPQLNVNTVDGPCTDCFQPETDMVDVDHAGHDTPIVVVDHVEQSIMANDVPQLNVNTVDGPCTDCFQPETDMVEVDHAGNDTPIAVVDHVEQSTMANDVPQLNVNTVDGPCTDCFQPETDMVDVDHAEFVECMHILDDSSRISSDRVDKLPSEVQDDIMELYNNNVEGVRAPYVRIEEIDVISQTDYMEEQEEEEELMLYRKQQTSYGRKRKIPWTSEEEEKLEEGVKKFEKTKGKGIITPWKHILAFGAGVFHPLRSADNLKDKWRRMCSEKIVS